LGETIVLFIIKQAFTSLCCQQVMVFVHARNATVKTAMTLREMAANQGDAALFHAPQSPEFGQAEKQVQPVDSLKLGEQSNLEYICLVLRLLSFMV